jgi:nitrogenase molybdenum-iron protein alpha/beta subunit
MSIRRKRDTSFDIAYVRDTALLGTCLAGYAISDAVIMMCGGIGCKAKITWPLAFHDQKGDFASRFAWPEFSEQEIVTGDLERLKRAILGQVKRINSGFIPVVIAPLIRTVGLDIGSYVDKLRNSTGLPVHSIPVAGVNTDIWQGYLAVLKCVARMVPWRSGNIIKHSVNIWGYPFDRYEGDHLGNIKVLQELLEAIGIRVQAIFFSGVPLKELLEAGQASLNVVFPLAHSFGRELKELSGIPTICTGLPLGRPGTTQWLYTVARSVFRNDHLARMLVERAQLELDTTRNDRLALNKRKILAFVDDHWVEAMADLLSENGYQDIILGRRGEHAAGPIFKKEKKITVRSIRTADDVVRLVGSERPDWIIASDREFNLLSGTAIRQKLHFGFPMYQKHYPENRPFLGYKGAGYFMCDSIKSKNYK